MTTSTSQRQGLCITISLLMKILLLDLETRKKATPFVLFLAEERKPFETLLYVRCARVFGSGGKLKKIPFFLKMEKILSSIITVSDANFAVLQTPPNHFLEEGTVPNTTNVVDGWLKIHCRNLSTRR